MRTSVVIPCLLGAAATLAACHPASHPSAQDADVTPDAGVPRATSISFTVAPPFTIVNGNGKHVAFPDVTRLPDGDLILVYRQGASHVDPTGEIMKVFGSADATSWSAPSVLYDAENIDDRDPSVKTLPNGTVVVNEFQYPVADVNGTADPQTHIFVGSSDDQGKTFGSFQQVDPDVFDPSPTADGGLWDGPDGQPLMVWACSSPIIDVDGTLLLAGYGGPDLASTADIPDGGLSSVNVYESASPAGPWTIRSQAHLPGIWVQEPALLSLGGGRMIMQTRSADGDSASNAGNLQQATSDDDGRTWTTLESLGFVGQAPDLLRLANGVIVSAFRELDQAFTWEHVAMMWSLDDGRTWTEPLELADCNATECAYPSLLELDGNRLFVTYYAPGGTAIMGMILPFQPGYDGGM